MTGQQAEFEFLEEEPGAEDERDLDTLTAADFEPLRVSSVDWTVGTLLDQIEMNELDIAPSFQRRNAWGDVKRSRLVESLILGVPVPQVILADLPQRTNQFPKIAGWTVLDGKQRLLAIASFLRPALLVTPTEPYEPLRLRGMTVLKDLNGLTFDDLEAKSAYKQHLFNLRTRTLRTVLVENAQDDRALHMIFLRLNTETVRLSPQELRQAEFPGPFTRWIAEASARSEPLHRAIRIDGADFRMRDMEILLRYFAFAYYLDAYNGNMKTFLDSCLRDLNDQMRRHSVRPSQLQDTVVELEHAIEATFEIFSAAAFTSLSLSGYEQRFNRTVFDVMTYFFSSPRIRDAAISHSHQVAERFEDLTKDPDFSPWIQTTTKSKTATFGRLFRWGEELQRITRLPVFDERPVPAI
jgi:hypothetical protein